METAAPSKCQWRNDGIHTRTVLKSSVDHRTRFVNATTDLRNNAVDDLHQVSVVAKLDVRLLHLSLTFDIDVLRTVDQDVADLRVLKQQLQGPETKGFVEHFVDQPLAFAAVQQRVFRVAEMLDDHADLAAQSVSLELTDFVQIQLVDELAVDTALEVFKFGVL